MKIKLIALCCITSFPTLASVDWNSMKATLVDEQQLSEMRGKYVPNGLYFGVQMLTHWSDNSGSNNTGTVGMQVKISPSEVSITELNGDISPTYEVTNSGSHNNGSGIVQIVQIKGIGNSGQNNSQLRISNASSFKESSPSGTANLTYYNALEENNSRIGYRVTIGESSAIQELRSIGSAQGVYQGISIAGNGINIENQMIMDVQLPESFTMNKSLQTAHTLLKTLK